MTKVIDPGPPNRRGYHPEPLFTSLSHAVRWIASGFPIQSLADQEATGDLPDVTLIDYSRARLQLLLALRHQKVSAQAVLRLQHKSTMYEAELDRCFHFSREGSDHWDQFLTALNEKSACFSTERFVSDAPINVPSALWEDRFIRWDHGWLSAWVGDYEACLMPIEISARELSDAFMASTDQPQPKTPKSSRPSEEAGSLNTKEKESLLKLVIGMAVAAYRYNPQAARSDIPTEIVNDLIRAGVPLDADTVRKFLRLGAKLLPPEALDDRES